MTVSRYPSRSFRAALTGVLTVFWFGGATLHAQSTPEMREVLSRLERLEDSNRALLEEVRALRKELASSRESAPDQPAASVTAPRIEQLQEQVNVHSARIDEMAQSKVEASQKLPIRITGMALFNAYRNGRSNGGVENPSIASFSHGDATGGGTLRQTVLGLQFQSPTTVLGAQVNGSVFMDFYGGSTAPLDHLLRLRTARVSLDWARTSITVGQDKPIISPRDPDSLAQVGVSPLTGAGNLWLWQPQIRLEQRLALGTDWGLNAQVGIFQTRSLSGGPAVSNPYGLNPAASSPVAEHAKPGVEGRFELWHRWGENNRVEIAPGFHWNSSTVGTTGVPSQLYSIDWFLKPGEHLEISGMFYHGQNVANLGALPQGFVVFPSGRVVAVHSAGGWAQLRIPVTSRLAFDIYGGQQADRESDLIYGRITSNERYAANVMYQIAPNVILSFEASQLRTAYYYAGHRLNNHYDLAVAYLF